MKATNLKHIFVTHRSQHHAQNSGYSRLLDYFKSPEIISGKAEMPYKLAKTIAALANQNAGLYEASSVFKELELFKKLKALSEEPSVVHYLNAERDIRRVVQSARAFKNTAFCATFHKPPEILEARITKATYLRKLDAAIAVGENQVAYLKDKYRVEKVQYIPHGVDTDFFKPQLNVKQPNTLLFVGQHLRDFKAFNYCVPRIAEKVKDLKVNVVLHKAFEKKITPHVNIQCYSGLSDMELRNMYQKSSVLFLPMYNSTACNSILESLACGLPIITNDVGGNSAYLAKTKNILAPPNDYDYLIEATVSWLKDNDKLEHVGATSREKAIEYEWSKIAQTVSEFHRTLL